MYDRIEKENKEKLWENNRSSNSLIRDNSNSS